MYTNLQSNRLNTTALRASYSLPYYLVKAKGKLGVVYFLPKITKTETSLSVSVLGVDPFKLAKFH